MTALDLVRDRAATIRSAGRWYFHPTNGPGDALRCDIGHPDGLPACPISAAVAPPRTLWGTGPAARELGLSPEDRDAIRDAADGYGPGPLRRALLEATGLDPGGRAPRRPPPVTEAAR